LKKRDRQKRKKRVSERYTQKKRAIERRGLIARREKDQETD
jgi:hypothetical protein